MADRQWKAAALYDLSYKSGRPTMESGGFVRFIVQKWQTDSGKRRLYTIYRTKVADRQWKAAALYDLSYKSGRPTVESGDFVRFIV
ncbi:hypothetical protein M6D81_09555 [Paenibacillus sp. J5C_2022]|nr:hypothetical protein [Paenibacillus sp. J5C2022]